MYVYTHMKVKVSISCQSYLTLCNSMDYIACQVPLSIGFPRQEYWSGLLFSPPGNLHNPGIEPRTAALLADSLPTELPRCMRKCEHTHTRLSSAICKLETQEKWWYDSFRV